MKKVMALCLAAVMCLSLFGAGAVFADETTIKVRLNGIMIGFDQPPIIEDGRTLVPMRKIFEVLGATVEWNDETQTVTATKDDTVIIMEIGNNVITKNGEEITLDVPPKIVNERTLVPVRAVAECLDTVVTWNDNTQTVTISTGNYAEFPYVPDFGIVTGANLEYSKPTNTNKGFIYRYGLYKGSGVTSDYKNMLIELGFEELDYHGRYLDGSTSRNYNNKKMNLSVTWYVHYNWHEIVVSPIENVL